MLIDTHCHLDDERLLPEAAQITADFEREGLLCVISSSSDYSSSVVNVGLADAYERVYATVGIHPHGAKGKQDSHYDDFKRFAQNPKIVAIGEIGLDYFYDLSPRDVQKRVFAEQLELADSLRLPVVFHVRDAYEDFLKIVKENKKYLNNGAALHCYSGSAEFMRELEEFDFYYGFDGPITYKNARRSIEALRAADINRVLFETDAPYLAPVPQRGKTNRPEYVRFVVEKAAEYLGVDFNGLSDISINNAKRLFKRIK